MSHLEYNLKMDVELYQSQLEAFDKAIASQAFAELSEGEKASRLRSRAWLADYLQEAKADLEDLRARQ